MIQTEKPVAAQLRDLDINSSVDIPQNRFSAINSAINYLQLSLDRSYVRNTLKESKTIRVTRIA